MGEPSATYKAKAFPDPDYWFKPVKGRSGLKLASTLDFRIKDLKPTSRYANHRIRQLDRIPRDAQAAWAGFYISRGLLSKDVAYRVSRLPTKEIEKLERVWRSIEDCLLLSSPESFLYEEETPVIKTLFRWTVSMIATADYELMLKQWKSVCTFITFKGLKAEGQEDPPLPDRFPGTRTLKSGKVEWVGLGLKWLDLVIERGVLSKGEVTRMAHFTSTRGCPPPTREMISRALQKHMETLTLAAPELTPERYEIIWGLSRRIGRKIGKVATHWEMANPEHVSLSNSSSFMYPRSDGGRARAVQDVFGLWAESSYSNVGTRTHVLGTTYEATGAKWRCVRLYELKPEEMSSDLKFGDALPAGPFLGTARVGYNRNLGYQLLQCAAEAAQQRGILDADYNVVGYPYVRAAVSSEPGGKARIVTANEWFVNILLQPLGHLLIGLLERLPQARAGLGMAEPAWEWAEDLKAKAYRSEPIEEIYHTMGLLSSDLSEATDHCHRELCEHMLKGFFEGCGAPYESGYLHTAISLLCCRKILFTRAERPKPSDAGLPTERVAVVDEVPQ